MIKITKTITSLLMLSLTYCSTAFAQNKDSSSQPSQPEASAVLAGSASALPLNMPEDQLPVRPSAAPTERTVGLELNIARLVTFDILPARTFSGGISFFDNEKATEVSIPIYYGEIKDKIGGEIIYASTDIDAHFRKFFGETAKGFYFSGFLRSTYHKGFTADGHIYSSGEYGNRNAILRFNQRAEQFKAGFGVGIGYRLFSKNGMYWGTSLSVGRFVIGKNNIFFYGSEPSSDDQPLIVDIEFLKFGYAF